MKFDNPQSETENSPRRNLQPRNYQLMLLEYLQERNGIVYLPTGSGKTFIAIMVLKRFSSQLQNTIRNGGKRAVFMCNTIELAHQQAMEIRKCSQLKVGLYLGERNVESWSKEQWYAEIDENQVLVGIARIFSDLICQGLIKVTDLSVVVIDECHHGRKNHPMHAFMGLCEKVENKELLPRIVGLTGVLIKGNKLNNIAQQLESLETAFRGNIITQNSDDEYHNLMIYSTRPKEELVTYIADRRLTSKIEDRIKQMVFECKKMVDICHIGDIPARQSKNLSTLREPSQKSFVKNLLEDFLYQMNDFGLYTAAFAIMSVLIDTELKMKSSETIALRKMYRLVIVQSDSILHLITKELEKDLDDPKEVSKMLSVIHNNSSAKLRALLDCMRNKFIGKDKKDIRCLIFVERRNTAKCLYFVLKKFIELTPELRDTLQPDFIVGQTSNVRRVEILLAKKSKPMRDFRKGVCNLLVCSNVLEEGIDVQSCNYVFTLDKLKTFDSYVQTKGRARSNDATYVIFAPQSSQMNIEKQLEDYHRAQQEIETYLKRRVLNDDGLEEDDICKNFTEEIPPISLPNGPSIFSMNALSILYRYCQQLQMDAFGVAKPWFLKEMLPDQKHFRVGVQMPIQSTVKATIYGDIFPIVRSAKISAAMKACQKLFEAGEINDRLQPVTKVECVASVSETLFDHWRKFNDDVTFNDAGKKDTRSYNCKYPEELYNAVPQIGEKCYAYEIKIIPNFGVNDYSHDIAVLLNSNRSYAILTRKKLPALAEMPLYMNQGKISVKISNTPIVTAIQNDEQMDALLKYHLMIFRDVISNWKPCYALDSRNLENAYLIVPLADGGLNWNLVKSFPRILPQRNYSTTERQSKVYNSEDFLGKIVNKWYSGTDHQRFVVTKVLKNITPMSPFDDETFKSYVDFYETRYKAEVERIVQPDTFMLEVRELTPRRNFFINAVGKSVNKHRTSTKIRLIPELCHNFMYPGDMWLKALLLPSILHRVHYMLHAETLRKRINSFLNIESAAYEPLPIEVDESLPRAVGFDRDPEEECVNGKKLLPNLTTSTRESASVEETSWKDFFEPRDVARSINSIYPVELEYYYKFVSGKFKSESSLFQESAEDVYKSTQTNMAENNVSINEQSLHAVASTDAQLDEKRLIDIIELTLKTTELRTAEQSEFLAAITTAGAVDVFDMERYEFLGDSFLKFSVSLYLVNRYPKWNEGFLTVVKSKMISNRNLLYCMLNTDIPERVCANLFKPKDRWLPPLISLPSNLLGLLQSDSNTDNNITTDHLYSMNLKEDEVYSGKCTDDHIQSLIASSKHNVGAGDSAKERGSALNFLVYKSQLRDKVIADTMEAILGVCVKNYGIFQTFRMLEFFGICKPEENQSLTHLLDLKLGSPLLHANISSREVDGFLINYQQLEKNLNYKFRDRAYLLQALTHPSFPTNRITGCYQELEFIGDAILDFFVTCYIFERHKAMTPGKLTDLRMALVNNITLGCVCVRHRFHLFMLYENAALAEAITNFDAYQKKHQHCVTDQVNILMEEDEVTGVTCNLLENVDVPKALGDILEALIAAVYLDSRDLRITWDVIYHLLAQEFNQFSRHVPLDAVRQLHDNKHANPMYSDPVQEGNSVMVTCKFRCLDTTIEVSGVGKNSIQAKKAAAKGALRILAKISP